MTTKIHTRTDALGNPTCLYLTGGAHDLLGSDELLDLSISHTWLVDRACDADARVISPIKALQGIAVIPSKRNRLQPRVFDPQLYKARHLIEKFFANATRYDKLAIHFLSAIHLVSCVVLLN